MLRMGDVMVIPAGISHCSSTSSSDYRFVVLFPRVFRPQRNLVMSPSLTTIYYRTNQNGKVCGVMIVVRLLNGLKRHCMCPCHR